MPSVSSLMPETVISPSSLVAETTALYSNIERLYRWLEDRDYRAYDTFDGLNARFVRPLTFNNALLRTVLLRDAEDSR